MFCEKCGAETTQKAKYCQSCGAELNTMDSFVSEQIGTSPEHSVASDSEQYDEGTENTPKNESKTFLGGIYHPWRRFFARTVDVMLSGILIFLLFSFLIGYLFPQNIDGFVKFIENPIVATIVLGLLWLPFEALFLSVAGTTPAKWIFGIRVINKTGEKLSYSSALKRAFLVFVQGEGFGIPLVTLVTRLFAYRRLTNTGTTLWDTSIDSVVTHKKWGVVRAIFCVFITLFVLVLMSILISVGKS